MGVDEVIATALTLLNVLMISIRNPRNKRIFCLFIEFNGIILMKSKEVQHEYIKGS